MNFCKRSYQPISHYLYTETIKRGGEISLHKHFKISSENDSIYLVTVFSKELEKFLGEDVSEFTTEEIGDKLLSEKNIVISFNSKDIVTLIEHQ